MSEVKKELSLEGLAAIVEKQNETIAGLQAQLLEKSAIETKREVPKVPKDPVKVGNKTYKFNVAKFAFPGSDKQYLSEEVATDNAILKKLLAIEGQGILTELV